jgi:hypothetical protein
MRDRNDDRPNADRMRAHRLEDRVHKSARILRRLRIVECSPEMAGEFCRGEEASVCTYSHRVPSCPADRVADNAAALCPSRTSILANL